MGDRCGTPMSDVTASVICTWLSSFRLYVSILTCILLNKGKTRKEQINAVKKTQAFVDLFCSLSEEYRDSITKDSLASGIVRTVNWQIMHWQLGVRVISNFNLGDPRAYYGDRMDEQHSLIRWYDCGLLLKIIFPGKMTVVDLGIGTGFISKLVLSRNNRYIGKYVGIDKCLQHDKLRKNLGFSKKVKLYERDFNDLDIGCNDAVTHVVMCESLHCVEDQLGFLQHVIAAFPNLRHIMIVEPIPMDDTFDISPLAIGLHDWLKIMCGGGEFNPNMLYDASILKDFSIDSTYASTMHKQYDLFRK